MLQKKTILDGLELVLKDIISIWVQIEVVKSLFATIRTECYFFLLIRYMLHPSVFNLI